VAVCGARTRAHGARGCTDTVAETDSESERVVGAFETGLGAAGWHKGRNLELTYRWGASNPDLLSRYAEELVRAAPDILLAFGTAALIPLHKATTTIPIVFAAVSDPVGQGFVASVSHPGGNLTGFSNFDPDIGSRWLQVLKDIAPETTRTAAIFNPDTAPYYKLYMSSIETGGASFAIKTFEAPVRSRVEIEAAISGLAREPGGAVISMSDTFTVVHRDLIIALAAQYRLPAVYPFRFEAIEGGLISYGTDQVDQYRRAAAYVDRILKGEKPADMPVQIPVKFEMAINLKTARTLGLAIPNTLLARADQVIE